MDHAADVGFALDGDADRCLAVDAAGNVVDGDQILAILALAMRERGRLHDDTVVATVMSNLGFVRAMTAAGIDVRQTAVGDRYVLEEMKAGGFTLGGEQSGHVIMSELRHHRRRHPHLPPGAGPDGGDGLVDRRPGRGDDPIAAGPGQRAGRRQGEGLRRPGPAGGSSPRRRPSSATAAGFCCAPRAPKPWCGSWSRRRRQTRPRRWRTGWPTWSASDWRLPTAPACQLWPTRASCSCGGLVAVAGPPGGVPDQRGQRRREEHRHHERRDEDAEREREAHRDDQRVAAEHQRGERAGQDHAGRGDRRSGVLDRLRRCLAWVCGPPAPPRAAARPSRCCSRCRGRPRTGRCRSAAGRSGRCRP